MPKINFIIIDQSYLIAKGLRSLIEKIPNAQIAQQIDQIDEIPSVLNSDADFIIINSALLSEDLLQSVQRKSDTTSFVLLKAGNNSLSKQVSWAEEIDLNESQNTILKKINELIGDKSSQHSDTDKPEEISTREADILRNIALGYSNKEIADKLFISAHTVVTHRKNLTRKLGIKTVPGLTIYAILNKLIDIDDQSKL